MMHPKSLDKTSLKVTSCQAADGSSHAAYIRCTTNAHMWEGSVFPGGDTQLNLKARVKKHAKTQH